MEFVWRTVGRINSLTLQLGCAIVCLGSLGLDQLVLISVELMLS